MRNETTKTVLAGDFPAGVTFARVLLDVPTTGRHFDRRFDRVLLVVPNWTKPGLGAIALGEPQHVVEMLEHLIYQLDAAGFRDAIDFLMRRRARARVAGAQEVPLFTPKVHGLAVEDPGASLVGAMVRGGLAPSTAAATRLMQEGAVALVRLGELVHAAGDLGPEPEGAG